LIVALVPAFNEEHYIASVLVRLSGVVDEIIVCDDGSTDLTGDIAEAMGVTVVRHERNMGYGAAIQSLFKAALETDAEVAVTIDGDGQHDPAELIRLVDLLRENDLDIVIGSRFLEGGSGAPAWRKAGIDVINTLSVNGSGLTDSQSGFRAYNVRALEVLSLTEDGMGASTEILLKAHEAGLRIGEVPINIGYHGDSSTHKPVAHGLSVVLSIVKHMSSRHPLLFFGAPGVTALLFSIFMWVFTFRNFSVTRTFSTNQAMLALTSTLVGISLITTSLIIWVMISVIREREASP
jgi:glycosyltransferase involved in cell wall biosynthesis